VSATNGDNPDGIEREDEVDDLTAWPGPKAAYATNWRTVLAVDAAMGGVVVLAGLIAMVAWIFLVGVFLTGLGLFYVALVVRRGRHWQRLRRAAGLDG
jgi:hypothetical protein